MEHIIAAIVGYPGPPSRCIKERLALLLYLFGTFLCFRFLLSLLSDEEDHQLTKQAAGLDAGQVTTWESWHRWTTICLLAYTYLAVAAAVNRDSQAGQEIG